SSRGRSPPTTSSRSSSARRRSAASRSARTASTAPTIRAATAASRSAISAKRGQRSPEPDAPATEVRLRRALRRRLAHGLASAVLLGRHLAAGPARFGKADRDRLLSALHRLAGAAALQRAPLALVHRLLDLFRRLVAIRCHESPRF